MKFVFCYLVGRCGIISMTKYKITDSTNDPVRVGDVMEISKMSVKSKSGKKKTNKNQAPMWFSSWVEDSFTPLAERIDNLVKNNNLKN